MSRSRDSKAAPELRLFDEPSDACAPEDLDFVVRQLRQVCRDSSLEFALRVGSIVIHNFFGGEIGAWRIKGPKATSFRRLAEHPDLPMSPAALYRCVAIFELCDRLDAITRWKQLGPSHLRAVLGLEPAEQERLLAIANQERWSVKKLEAAAIEQRDLRAGRSRRPRRSALVATLSGIQRNILSRSVELEHEVSSLDPGELARIMALIAEVQVWLQGVTHALEQQQSNDGNAS